MKTKLLKLTKENIDTSIINEAADLINDGQLVAFPTETVYGLGANGLDPDACKHIFEIKNRPADNPLILHISNLEMLEQLVQKVDENAKKLIKLWPGPLTIIFKKSAIIPDVVTAGGDTVAIRFPKNEIARALIEKANTPIAAPSANISGRPSPTNAEDTFFDLNGKIPLIINGGSSDIGIESTVIDLTSKYPTILRPGFYTFEMLDKILDNLKLDDALVDDSKIPKSPGQKYKHYAPNAKMKVFIGKKAPTVIKEKADYYKNRGNKVGILVFENNIKLFNDYETISLGDFNDLSYMSHVLFSSLRKMDKLGVDIILAQGVMDNDLGKSIMNRMRKSASGDIEYV